MKSLIINLTLFKAGWLACVFGAAAGLPQIGIAAVAVAAAVHLWLARDARNEGLLLVLAAALGISWESALVASGVVGYDVGVLLPGIAPYWIVAMWILFATTLNSGMRWLRKSPVIASIAGAIGGPMSFLAGQKAGAVTFSDPVLALTLIGAGWAALLPIMGRGAVWLDEMDSRLAFVGVPTEGEES